MIIVRRASPGNGADIWKIEQEAFLEDQRWEEADLEHAVGQDRVQVAVDSTDGVVGYVSQRTRALGALLDSIAVLRAHQGKGVGTALMESFFSKAQSESPRPQVATLDCDVDLVRFYSGFGFVVSGFYVTAGGRRMVSMERGI